jgi:hypothetical protein
MGKGASHDEVRPAIFDISDLVVRVPLVCPQASVAENRKIASGLTSVSDPRKLEYYEWVWCMIMVRPTIHDSRKLI